MIASYHETDSEKDISIKKEKISEIEEYLSKQEQRRLIIMKKKNSDDSSDELYNQTFSAQIITQSNSNDNVGTTFNLSHGEE